MHSALTRLIFRRILRNEPIIHRDCLYRRASQIRTYGLRVIPHQRRTLFGWISPVPREALAATGEKASLVYLKDACTRLDNQVRAPPADQLAKAWTAFVKERHVRKGKFSDVEAVYTRRIFALLKDTEEVQLQQLISNDAIQDAMYCIPAPDGAIPGNEAAKSFIALSRTLFDEADARAKHEVSSAEWRERAEDGKTVYEALWLRHLATLTRYGRADEARDAIIRSELPRDVIEIAWRGFLRRLATGNAPLDDLDSLPALIERQVGPITTDLKMKLAELYASRADMARAKQFAILKQKDGKLVTDHRYIRSLLDACRRQSDLEWGRDIIRTITTDTEAMRKHQGLWNAMFIWALATGKSVDEVNRMMDVMVRTNPRFTPLTCDFNALIKVANEKNEPYLAERLVALGEKWGNSPDEETYLLQMDYRLSINDVEGARTAFDFVKSFQEDREDASPRINRLIQAMCNKKTYSFDTIMDVVDFLGERNGRFEVSTVAALSLLHLNRDEYTDVADLLTTNIKDFSLADRALVRQSVLDLMLDPSTPLSRLWDTYMIFQHIFEEAPRKDRIAIMQRFFDRERPDMAIHVFNHMRRHNSPEVNPDTETYVTALIGCGHTHDDESLAVVNNILKLDLHVEETTRLHNARMIAFFGAGESEKAQAVWDDIIRSDEGPSRNSLLLVFRVCEQSDFGDIRARSVWEMVRRMDVPLDAETVAAYVGALAGNGCDDDARHVVEQCGEELGVDVDEMILAKLFNGTANTVRQVEVEKWITERYPDIWAKLEKKGFTIRYDDTRALPLDVKMEP